MSAPGTGERQGTDLSFMRAALNIAARGLGRVAPNPAVGCVIVHDGHVVGRGWTQPGGRPHAETEALARAGAAARGATAYVTLEPCAHHGVTPPCADALVEAGIARVVIACLDTDSRVSGRGVARLEAAGTSVTIGVCQAEALDLNAGFFLRTASGRPLVTLKTATTLDGFIATRTGESRWITGEGARARGHLMRARHDAIIMMQADEEYQSRDEPGGRCSCSSWRWSAWECLGCWAKGRATSNPRLRRWRCACRCRHCVGDRPVAVPGELCGSA